MIAVELDVMAAAWLATKPRPRFIGRVCEGEVEVDAGDGTPQPCRRPVWGDGEGIQGAGGAGLCSRCWHVWNAFHGPFQTMRANPAAAQIDNTGLARLFISRGLDAEPLPPVGNDVPDTFPPEWH